MYCFIYITNPDRNTATKIAELLLEHKLIACANIYDGVGSLYFWQGKLEESREVVLIGKTRRNLFSKIEELVTKNHPYEIPCITALPIVEGNSQYINWIESSLVNS